MIDVTVQQQGGGVLKRPGKKSHGKTRRKHDAINLPKNLSDSEQEVDSSNDQLSSDDENVKPGKPNFLCKGIKNKTTTDDLSCSYLSTDMDEKKRSMNEALIKLKSVVKKYKDDLEKIQLKKEGLKARGPYKNKLEEHKKNKHYDPTCRSDPRRSFPKEHELESNELYDLINAIQDVEFMASFKKLSEEEVEHVFNTFLGEAGSQTHMQRSCSVTVQNRPTPSPEMGCYRGFIAQTPVTSPLNVDHYDSGYETLSPSSTVITSPGSPAALFSPPRNSVSYESDHELESYMENCRIQPKFNVVSSASIPSIEMKPEFVPRPAPIMKPLGEVVPFIKTSATDRLVEFQNSTKFFTQHFSIELVRVIMSAKGQSETEKVEAFSKSLMKAMKTKLGKRPNEGEIWQLSILAHVQFLLARAPEYKSALLIRDEHNHSLMYIAAMEQYQKPLIARYIAESMYKVGFNPLEVDEKGNTVLHLLAEQGDSHVHVLSELLMVCGAKCVQAVNKVHQTVLHAAVCSPKTHLTTVLTLLKMRANPLQQDLSEKSPLYYHIKQLAQKFPRPWEDVEVVRKMLQSVVSFNTESLIALNLLSAEPSIPADLKGVILEEVRKYGVKVQIKQL